MSEQYKRLFTKFIIAEVKKDVLDIETVQSIQQTFASDPQRDPEYLASLDEALSILLGPEDIVRRGRDREGLPPAPEGGQS